MRFNPRTREGCDKEGESAKRGSKSVSIHAPARGATLCDCQDKNDKKCFNPRTREGCDYIAHVTRKYKSVSIHAPARGATIFGEVEDWCLMFQSTHPRGVRHTTKEPTQTKTPLFQSTHPRGVRQPELAVLDAPILVSIHAPARGATSFTDRFDVRI